MEPKRDMVGTFPACQQITVTAYVRTKSRPIEKFLQHEQLLWNTIL